MEEIFQAIQRNLNKDTLSERIEMPGENNQGTNDESTELQYGILWARLQPPGPISLWKWSVDPLYRGGTEASRRQVLNQSIIELQARVQQGDGSFSRKWSKTKISEALGLPVANAEEDTFTLLEMAVSQLAEIQWVRMNENEKKITLVPEDLRLWRSDRKILWTRERYRSSGEVERKNFTLKSLSSWLSDREIEGWKITYPVAEGKFETLKAAWDSLNRGSPTRGPGEKGRILEEDYAKALGKVQAIQWLLNNGQAPQQIQREEDGIKLND